MTDSLNDWGAPAQAPAAIPVGSRVFSNWHEALTHATDLHKQGRITTQELEGFKSKAGVPSNVGQPMQQSQPTAPLNLSHLAGNVGLGVAGLVGDVPELGARGINAASRYVGDKLGIDVPNRQPDEKPVLGNADIRERFAGWDQAINQAASLEMHGKISRRELNDVKTAAREAASRPTTATAALERVTAFLKNLSGPGPAY